MDAGESVLFQNRHWREGKFETYEFKRHIFAKIWNDIDTNLIALLTGPRRTGKSVLIKQIANELILKRQVNPREILFFEFSPNQKRDTIWQVFNYFTKEISDPRLPQFLFFDEIQYIKGYEVVVKEIYDNTKATKIFMTGSLSLSYKKRMEESLAGRFFPYKLFPLNFSEYLELANPKSFDLFKKIQKEEDMLKREHLLSILNSDFRYFLSFGRLPEMINFTKEQSESYLKTIISQSLNQDIFSYFEIEKPQIINALFEYLRINNGGLISINSLASELGTSNQTISLYLNVLEVMGLIYLVYNSTNPAIRLNASKKAYLNSAFGLLDTKLDIATAAGFAVESYILERLLEKEETVTFWKKRSKEIDFLLPKKKTAYEVKFTSNPPNISVDLKDYNTKLISLQGNLPACLF